MGFWSGLGKIIGGGALAVGGVVTGNPGLVATGAGIAASGVQGKATDDALQQQQQATNQAQGNLDQVYRQARADYAPYQQTGQGALGALNLGMGLPALQPVQPVQPSAQASAPMVQRSPNGQPFAAPGAVDTGQQAVPRSLAQLATSTAAQEQTASSYVPMLSPTGQRGMVPAAMVDRALAAGGQVIGGTNG